MNNINQRIASLSPEKRAILEQRLKQKAAQTQQQKTIPKQSRSVPLPLSFSQQRMWLLNQLEPGNPAYNRPTNLSLTGHLDILTLEKSLNEIVRRHEVLRTSFSIIDEEPVQIIAPKLTLTLPIIDLTTLSEKDRDAEIQKVTQREAQKPFDLTQSPLFRVKLLQLSPEKHLLLLTFHHIIFDGWSAGVFKRELANLYEAFLTEDHSKITELPIQYADFAQWQRQQMQAENLQHHLAYWNKKLRGELPVLELPTDGLRSPIQTFRGAKKSLLLSPYITQGLKALSLQEGVTLFMTLLAAFKTLLYRYTHQEDIIIGSPIAGRDRRETEQLIGVFINTLVLRTPLQGNLTFKQLLLRVKNIALEAYAHKELPFEKLVEELQVQRDLSRHPIFDVMFNYNNTPPTVDQISELSITPLPEQIEPESKFSMTLYVQEKDHRLNLKLVYQKALFSAERMTCFLYQYQNLLEQIVDNPNHYLQSYSLITPQSRSLLPNPKMALPQPEYEPITHQFSTWVNTTPDQPAICQGSRSWSYQQLSQTAQEISEILITDGIKPGEVVAVCGERSFGMIASIIGILSSGGVLLTLDQNLPQQRQQLFLTTAKAQYLLYVGQQKPQDQWMAELLNIIFIDPNNGNLNSLASHRKPQSRSSVSLYSDNAAYIFFTSGTTGIPKGVLGCHKGLSHFLNWQRHTFDIQPQDRVSQLTGISFDVVLREIFLPLTSGATLCLLEASDNLTSDSIFSWLEQQKISVIHTVPTLAQTWFSHLPGKVYLKGLRWVFFAGEPLSETLVRQWRNVMSPNSQIVNLYGPTETTLAKCYYQIPNTIPTRIQPVGFPLPQTQALVVTENNQLCGIGELGEIVIRTPFRTLGYINASEENQRRFVKNPFRDDPKDLLYYTGDCGRYRPNGSLEILGRKDFQVKIRGIRIELSEIETVLTQHPEIKETVVIVKEDPSTNKSLIAYIVPDPNKAPNPKQLRQFLKQQLPEYMLPAAFVTLEALPLTPNGKIDRRHLPAPESQTTPLDETFVAPTDELEQKLVQIWQQVLGKQPIGIADNFFELGGHSLLAVQLFNQIEKQLGQKLPLSQLFQSPTIQELAPLLRDSGWQPSWSSLVPIKLMGSHPPLFCVHGIGGEVLNFKPLSKYLDIEQPLYALRAQGLDGKHPPHTSIEEMAAHYLEEILQVQPIGPYFLGGYSSGGRVAFEIARQLTEAGQSVAFLGLFDCGLPDDWLFKKVTHQAPGLKSDYAKKVVDASRFALKHYCPKVYSGRAILFQCEWKALENESSFQVLEKDSQKYLLSEFIQGGCSIQLVPGQHTTILKEPHVQVLSEKLNMCLEKARIESQVLQNSDLIELYQKVIDTNPLQPFWVYRNIGDSLTKQGDLETAIIHYQKAVELQPYWVYQQLAGCLSNNDTKETALVVYDQYLDYNSKKSKQSTRVWKKIQDKIQRKQGKIKAYQKALEWQPIWLYQNLKSLLNNQEETEAVLTVYQKAIDCQPYSPTIYQKLGNYQLNIGQIESAFSSYNKAVEIEPNSAILYCGLGDAYQQKGETESALFNYQKAIELNPKSFTAYQKQGLLFQKNQQFEKAIESYQKAIQLQPERSGIYCNIGRCHLQLAQLEKGKASFRQAIEMAAQRHQRAPGYQGLADIFKKQGQLQKALVNCQKAIQFQPNFIPAYLQMGYLKKQQGLLEEAITHYQKVIELNSNHFEGHKNLGSLLQKSGNFEAAITHYQQAAKIKPKSPEIHRNLGYAHWKNKEIDKAILSYQKSIEINPKQPFRVYHILGDALSQKGREEEAIVAYHEALKLQPENPVVRRSLERISKSIEKRSSAVESD